jgi:hypothetical protein
MIIWNNFEDYFILNISADLSASINEDTISVSGFSSGGCFSTQFHFAFSKSVRIYLYYFISNRFNKNFLEETILFHIKIIEHAYIDYRRRYVFWMPIHLWKPRTSNTVFPAGID